MAKKLFWLAALMIMVIAIFTGCSLASKIDNERTLESIAFENIPDRVMVIGEFDSCGIQLRLHYSSGSDDVVPVYSSMFSEEYQSLLQKPGTHTIELLYRGVKVQTTVTLREKATWTLSFLNQNDEVVKTQVFEEDEEQIAAYPTDEEMAVDGYVFTGEYTPFTLPISNDVKVKGIYDKVWTVVFYDGDNVAVSVQQVKDGEAAIEPDEAAYAMYQYKFTAWDTDFSKIVKDTNVYGLYVDVTTAPTERYSEGLEYVVQDEETCTVGGIGTCTDVELVIPSDYEGLTVVGIEPEAFAGCTFIISVTIPESVESIGEKAFNGCSSLEIVIVPDSVEIIGDKAFSNCESLRVVIIPDQTEIGTDVFRGSIYVELTVKHNLEYVEAVEPTCTQPGNIAHYACHCGQYFADAEATIRLYDIVIPASHEFVDGVCVKCGTIQDTVHVVAIDEIPYLGKFALGTMENAIGLPELITVYTADGLSHTLPILWDLTGYDKSTVGEYVIHGHIQPMIYRFDESLSTEVAVGIEIVDFMEGTADIVFILDISGSMGDEISNVKNNIVRFAQAIEAQGVSARWSVITFSDFTEYPTAANEQTMVIKNGASDWFISAEEYKKAISSISLANGGDAPEVDLDGLMMASTLSTRKDVRTFYILLTDDTFKTNNHYGVSSLSEVVTVLDEKGVNVSVITTSFLQSTYAPLNTTTGGIWSNITGNFAQDLLDRLVPIIYSSVVD